MPGAGAPLLLPSSCGTAGEGGQGDKSEGITRPRQSRRGDAKFASTGSASILQEASDRRPEEGRGDRFSPCWGRGGQSPLSPSKAYNEHTRRRRSRSQFAHRLSG
ncbi:hypothetical protein CN081_34130 [Sinorhizobium meliloti]|nr:hypothetical protein CN199_34295 [Sinorhizobium meliloti]RVL09848.1 hypothetical protein CN143_34080 [Sinorhizobium meliloti]RVM21203.1 hypothetical protein CN130_35010 [Sinorhizobium meliloti]RVP29139.1 hypothetical protein CN081_34130 [Sinorhizobium meliloti]RVR00775.1 hypothetical protein CN243_34120 [Sinorhizobium meliloti]